LCRRKWVGPDCLHRTIRIRVGNSDFPAFLKACRKAPRLIVRYLGAMSHLQPPSDAEIEKLKREIRARLSRVCEGWTPAAFEALVEDIAETELRYRDPTKGPRK
jgi:hypothetical protein